MTYKYFQIIRDDNYNLKKLKFWNDEDQKYNREIDLVLLNPYQKVVQLPKVWDTDNYKRTSSIYFDISSSEFALNAINEKYPPSYTKNWQVYAGRLESHWEDLYTTWDKKNIVINFMLEIYNQQNQVLGHKSTLFLFNTQREILDTIKFEMPVYNVCVNPNRHLPGFWYWWFLGRKFCNDIPRNI